MRVRLVAVPVTRKPRQIPVRNPDIISKWIRALHDTSGLTYRQIAQKPYFSKPPSIPPGTIYALGCGDPMPNKYRRARGLPRIVKVPSNMVRKIKPVADQPRRLTRCTFYTNTDTDKIITDLYRVTGKTFGLLEGELEY